MNLYQDFTSFSKDKNVSQSVLTDYSNHIYNSYIEPTIIDERKLNATQISVFSRLFMERILFLGSEINADVANIINSQLLYLQMIDPEKPITLYINSPGGSVNAGLSIYDTFKFVSCPIETTCMGLAASMGAVLLSSGDKGKRSALPHSQVMIHQVLGGAQGQASDIKISYEEIMKAEKSLYDILSENTGIEYDEIKKLCDRDNWYTAEEAVKANLIDKVIKR